MDELQTELRHNIILSIYFYDKKINNLLVEKESNFEHLIYKFTKNIKLCSTVSVRYYFD